MTRGWEMCDLRLGMCDQGLGDAGKIISMCLGHRRCSHPCTALRITCVHQCLWHMPMAQAGAECGQLGLLLCFRWSSQNISVCWGAHAIVFLNPACCSLSVYALPLLLPLLPADTEAAAHCADT